MLLTNNSLLLPTSNLASRPQILNFVFLFSIFWVLCVHFRYCDVSVWGLRFVFLFLALGSEPSWVHVCCCFVPIVSCPYSSNSKYKTHNTPQFSIQEQRRIRTQHNICETGQNVYVKHTNTFEPCHTDIKFSKLVQNGCYYIIFNPSLLSTRYTPCKN